MKVVYTHWAEIPINSSWMFGLNLISLLVSLFNGWSTSIAYLLPKSCKRVGLLFNPKLGEYEEQWFNDISTFVGYSKSKLSF